MPVVEHTELFKRAIGEHTDVVGKEMYTFTDRGGDSLTLRPEATAGIVRALISNGMLRGQRHKLWCLGPMFRHEAPQAGRYRQFWQVDVEAVGCPGPDVDARADRAQRASVAAAGHRRSQAARSTPSAPPRAAASIARGWSSTCARTKRSSMPTASAASAATRCASSTARIPTCRSSSAAAPLLTEHLDAESRAHFAALCAMLDAVGVALPDQSAPGARARLLQPHRVRMDYRRPAAHRMPYAPAAATTA